MKFKKNLVVLLACITMFFLSACKGSASTSTIASTTTPESSATTAPLATDKAPAETPQDFKTFKIGVVEKQATDETVVRREFYENFIAPNYNVQFIFSEVITDVEGEVNFIENCADAGVDAIICMRGGTDAYQLSQIAADYGMLYLYQGRREAAADLFVADYDNFIGAFGASLPLMTKAYSDYLAENASDDGSEGFIILSSDASKGNLVQTDLTVSILQVLQDKYGLTYEKDLKTLAISDAPTIVKNNKDIAIYIYPGQVKQDGWLEGVSSALQSGRYGYLISTLQSYTQTSVVVDEVERTFDKNITVMSMGTMGDALTTAMNTMDKFGNPSVDFVALELTSIKSAGNFAMVYNALTGHKDNMRGSDGLMSAFDYNRIFLTSPEQLSVMEDWDMNGKWAVSREYVDGMLGIYHSEITADDIQEHLNTVTSYEYIYNYLEG